MTSATLKDVAKFANVSQATVSRVLNDNPSVDTVLRDRVNQAVHALAYQPNRAARRLRAQSSNVIGLIISDIQNPYFISIIRGIEDAAYAQNMNVILCNSDENIKKQAMYLNVMQAERVAGLIFVPTPGTNSAALESLMNSGVALTLLDRTLEDMAVDTVKVDNVRGAYAAVKHALELGYRRIAIIIASNDITTGRERYQGYLNALNEAGIPIDLTIIKYGDSRTESGHRLTYELVNTSAPPEVIFAGNNLVTLGALRALHELGKQVPQDIALIGFDDMPWSGELQPPLTAVSQPTYELGQEAVALLRRRIAEPSAPTRTVILQTTLIVRESCGSRLVTKKGRKPQPKSYS